MTHEKNAQRPKKILTGDRPAGRLHLGHGVGSLAARVKLQYEFETIVISSELRQSGPGKRAK